MKKNVIIFLTSFMILSGLSTQDKNLNDDYYLNLDLNTLIDVSADNNHDQSGDNTIILKKKLKTQIEDKINLQVFVSHSHDFEYSFVRDSTFNHQNMLDIDTYKYLIYTDIRANLQFGKLFQLIVDDSFRFIRNGNELYNLSDANHKNSFNQYLDNKVRELYLLCSIPILYPIQINFGRAYYSPGNSYLFTIFNDLSYQKKVVKPYLDKDNMGINMLKFSMFFPFVTFDIIYSPGIPESNAITEYFNIQEEQRFFGKIYFTLPYVNFGFNGYIDTFLKWSVGATISINATDELIIYGDFALKGKEKIYRLARQPEFLFGDMHQYQWDSTERLGFSGVLFGINYTPASILNIIGELYFSTNGLRPGEQSEFFGLLDDVYRNYENPQVISIPTGLPPDTEAQMKEIQSEQKKLFQNYYYGVLGNSLQRFSAFDFGMFYLFLKIGKDNIVSTGLDLNLSSVIYLLDGSAMIIPELQYHFFKFFHLIFSVNIFAGYQGSLFGEMPYPASMKLSLEIKI